MTTVARRPSALRFLVAGAIFAALGGFVWRYGSQLETARVKQATVNLPPGVAFASPVAQFALSPDGRRIAMNLRSADRVQVWTWGVDSVDARPLTGSEGVSSLPVWSPDSLHVAFVSEGNLRRMPAAGGPVQIICELDAGATFDWGADETVLIAPDGSEPIRRVNAAGGGRAQQISRVAPDERQTFPAFVPGQRRFLFVVRADELRDGLWIGSLDGGRGTRVVPHGANAAAARGYLVYSLDQLVIAQRFDAAAIDFSGTPVTLADHVRMDTTSRRVAFSVSGDRLAYQADGDGVLHLVTNWPEIVGAQ